MSQCHARQCGDQMQCGLCGLQWDVNDPDRPACSKLDRRTRAVRDVVKATPAAKPEKRADAPPLHVLQSMENARKALGNGVYGMQGAICVYLDWINE